MKKLILLIVLAFQFIGMAQNGINYKAIIKDGSGNILPNASITIQFSILQSALLINVYTESHSPTTDVNGLIIVNIGEGTLISGDYATIDWSRDFHFLNVQIDTGSGLVDMGNTEFKTVPYALNSFTTNDHYWDKTGAVLFNASEKIGIGTSTPTGKTEISYSSTLLDPTLTLTQEIDGGDPFARINFRNNINSNYWAIAARSELTPANNQFNIWNGTTDILSISGDGNVGINGRITINNPSSYGLKINSTVDNGIIINTPSIYGISMGTVGNTGVNILEATLGSGYYIGTAGDDGVYVGSAGNNGLQIDAATNDGIAINNAGNIGLNIGTTGNEGVFINSAATTGLYVNNAITGNGLQVNSAGHNGINIGTAGSEGIYINSATTTGVLVNNAITGNGLQVNSAGDNGLYVNSAANNGLHVESAGSQGIYVGATVNNGLLINSAGHNGVVVNSANTNGGFFKGTVSGIQAESSIDTRPDVILGGTENTATGDDGILASDPFYSSSDIFLRSNDAVVIQLDYDNDEAGQFEIKNGSGTEIFEVDESGNVRVNGTIVHSSDRRLKKDIEGLQYGLNEILQLQPKAYNWKNRNQDTKSLGLIAQEVQGVIKEIVTAKDDEQKTLGISYIELIPILINAIQEQQEIIENQNGKYLSLSQENSLIEQRLKKLEDFLVNENDDFQATIIKN